MYTPNEKTLQNYAHVLIDFALGGGAGIKKDDVVYVQFDAPALPLALAVYQRILERGGHPMVHMVDERFEKIKYNHASDSQLEFFPKKYTKTLIDTIDHRMYLISEADPLFLKSVDPKKIMKTNKSKKLFRKWLFEKEDRGELTWTLALYGTEGMAREAKLTLPEYWEQISKACFLDETDPIATWQRVFTELEALRAKMNALPIDKLHLTARDTDLWMTLGERRAWAGGSGRNIPSFEIFTSPDWRGTNGRIYFDQPLYRYGNIIKDIHLEFKEGRVVKANSSQNENLLKEMIRQPDADKIGEYSLTDVRYSRISKFMANTLFDENFGGQWGNTHLALGSSYHDCYNGDAKEVTTKEWEALGYNDSQEHCDIIAAHDRRVEATLKDGTKKVIYEKGQFVL